MDLDNIGPENWVPTYSETSSDAANKTHSPPTPVRVGLKVLVARTN